MFRSPFPEIDALTSRSRFKLSITGRKDRRYVCLQGRSTWGLGYGAVWLSTGVMAIWWSVPRSSDSEAACYASDKSVS